MKKIFFFVFLFIQCNIFSQIGFVSNINPKFKHIHAEVGSNIGVQNTEVFNYNLDIFLDKMIKESQIEINRFSDFDFNILDSFVGFQERKTNEYLEDFCKKKGVKQLIIFYRNNWFSKHSPYGNLYNLKFDFGILTQVGKKKNIYFMNRTLMAYYDSGTKSLNMTRVKGDNQREFIKINSKDVVIDNNSKLVNSESVQKDFINQYELKVRAHFMDALKNIH